ncbi:MAG: thioredoxin domain-containing protein [Acidobacteria bacterium]|nr:thioredoxin domain-containing protein [Acidobacteriota bacterium]
MLIRDEDPAQVSPYLAQHRDNPVDWWSWSPQAFAEAVRRDVPVLVSIGYSACHWCHVMAHESFEDPETGRLMNDLFVNIKVDREERPDVDAVYMAAVQAMVGRGGWPMTVFCLPDGRPFYAGTYFPKETRGNHLGFAELCTRIDELWRTRRADLVAQAEELVSHIAEQERIPPATSAPDLAVVDHAVAGLLAQLDTTDGGFGRAPKFPQSMAIDTLLRHSRRTGDTTSRDAALLCLDAMASGGIYDHLGGGFARYATDARWLIPHFEKMLYDQALLARVYLHAWQLTGEPRFRQVLDETIAYVLRDLRHPLGGFFAAEDADSQGVEGRFYVWSADGVRIIAGPDADAAIEWYGVTEAGNWEGTNILERVVRGDLIRPPAVERARAALFEARAQRVRPGLDTKVLLEWNGLMLATLAEAAAATGDPNWLTAAETTAAFLCDNLRRPDGRWLRTWQGPVDGSAAEGQAKILAYAADHGAMLDALVRLAEATGHSRWIDEAISTADALIELFWDETDGGVFTTGSDADALVTRPKDLMDNASPGANSLAAVGLLRLAAITGDERHRHHAERIIAMLGETAGRLPLGFGHMLLAVELQALGTTEIVISGDRPDLVTAVQRNWRPESVLLWGEPTPSPLWEGRDERGAEGRGYVCRDRVCGLPAHDVPELLTQLGD